MSEGNPIVDYQLKTDRTIVYINSKDRTRGGTSDFVLNMMPWIPNSRLYRVKTISVPFSWYVFRAGQNVFSLNSSVDGPITVTIPPGNYTTATLKTTLEALINPLITGNITITFNSTTQKMELVPSGGTQIEMNGGNLAAGTANEMLGFTSQQPLTSLLIGNNVFNLSGDQAIYLHSDRLRDENSLSTVENPLNNTELTYTSILHRVPVDVNSGSLIVDKWGSPWLEYPNNKITQLDFQLRHQDGSFVNLNGQDYTFVLEFLGSF